MSDGDNLKREPVFYYSREHRLNQASPEVRAMNEEKPKRSGFLQGFFGNKSNLVLFVTIILIFATFGLLPRLLGKGQGTKIGRNILVLSIQMQEEIPVLGIVKKTPQSGEFYTGAVEIAVSPVMPNTKGGEIPVFIHRINFKPLQSESFRVLLPFKGTDYFVTLKTGGEEQTLRIKIAKP